MLLAPGTGRTACLLSSQIWSASIGHQLMKGGICVIIRVSKEYFLFSALGGVVNLLSGSELYPYRYFLLFDTSGEALGAIIPLMLGYIFGASWEAIGDVLGYSSFLILSLLVVILLVTRVIRNVRNLKQVNTTHISQIQENQSNLAGVSTIATSETSTKSTGNLPLL